MPGLLSAPVWKREREEVTHVGVIVKQQKFVRREFETGKSGQERVCAQKNPWLFGDSWP